MGCAIASLHASRDLERGGNCDCVHCDGECNCVNPEERAVMIARWEMAGDLDPNCVMCQREFYADERLPIDVFAPRHKANQWCRSGKRNHCTCDGCF